MNAGWEYGNPPYSIRIQLYSTSKEVSMIYRSFFIESDTGGTKFYSLDLLKHTNNPTFLVLISLIEGAHHYELARQIRESFARLLI